MKSLSFKSLGCVAATVLAMQVGCSSTSVNQTPPDEVVGGSSSNTAKTSAGGNSDSTNKASAGGANSKGGSTASNGDSTTSNGGSSSPSSSSKVGATEKGGSSSSGSSGPNRPTTGGTNSSGGSNAVVAKGGSDVGASGAAGRRNVGAAGRAAAGAGAPAAGGRVAAGGSAVVGNGGAATAGASPTGTGGDSGGTPGAINWGKEENPTAKCTVGAMPEVSSLKANTKLPDPFTKMDGTRIKDKSEWACRREEILRQSFKYIYGDKPIPAKGSVTGTVSTTAISITVTEGGKSTKISATVKMNGATQPAPAIITYGSSGVSAPSGVASINFSPTETTGGSGAKSGPFFDIYGSNHAAGYMVSNAWLVSRIIDVLEQNPTIIDPYRVGVTGCSRWGKGAFVAGVLDNRIALTLPVESGIGGTVALRLVEQLDTSGEWPYHAISYVRWLSETALGQFTTGNSASADNTDKLPVDMHAIAALVIPRGLYIIDNPSSNYAGLDKNSAWVTGNIDKVVFQGLGYGDNFSYQGASGAHCSWRTAYDASLTAMIDKFLKGNASAKTGNVASDFSGPDAKKYYDWEVPTLGGTL